MLSIGIALSACAQSSSQESTGQYLDDSAITTKVKAAIFNDPALKLLEIQVVTFKGEFSWVALSEALNKQTAQLRQQEFPFMN